MDIIRTIILDTLKQRGIEVTPAEFDAIITVVNLIVRLAPAVAKP